MPTDRYLPSLLLIGGGAASGKSRIATEVVRRISNAILLDKDCLFGEWVDAVLSAHGHPSDRDCSIYWDYLRPLEYKTLERLAFDHLRLGKVAVIDAPLRLELDDPAWFHRINVACKAVGAKLTAAWIEVSPESARKRMQLRSELRDKWKLENWNEFIRRQNYQAPRGAQIILQNNQDEQSEIAVDRIIALLSD